MCYKSFFDFRGCQPHFRFTLNETIMDPMEAMKQVKHRDISMVIDPSAFLMIIWSLQLLKLALLQLSWPLRRCCVKGETSSKA